MVNEVEDLGEDHSTLPGIHLVIVEHPRLGTNVKYTSINAKINRSPQQSLNSPTSWRTALFSRLTMHLFQLQVHNISPLRVLKIIKNRFVVLTVFIILLVATEDIHIAHFLQNFFRLTSYSPGSGTYSYHPSLASQTLYLTASVAVR